jgi:hypothetical protein
MVTLAAEPGAFARTEILEPARGDSRGLGVSAGAGFRADAHGLDVDLGGDARLHARFAAPRGWPRRAWGALGPAHWVPGLGQYWTPHLLGARVTGEALGRRLDGCRVYAEKNWGGAFAGHWWWGQAHGLPGEATVCFAGGRTLGGAPTSVVLALDGRVHRWVPPLARTTVATARNRWRVRARGRLTIEIDAEAAEADVHVLPVPVVAERRVDMRSRQHLAGQLTVTVRRGRRVLYRGESALAGLERGTP